MTREEFIGQIGKFLKAFTRNGECWILEHKVPGTVQTISVNGQVQKIEQPGLTVAFKVEVVGDGEISGEPVVQILFEVSQNSTIISEYEEAFYYEDFPRFLTTIQHTF